MGGAIAVSLAARWPDEVDRLVLVAPALNLPYRTMFEGMRPLLAATHRMPLRFLPTLAYDALRAGPRTIVRASRSLFAIEEGQRFDSIRCPTLLIWGDRDTLVPLALADRLLALLPGSQLCVIKRAGHVVMFDRASEFNNAVLQFLASGAVGG
jgi:pimeloyl-ACP methyl ester carboxylesterase